ncbi:MULTISPECIES: hypothetical protein [Pseudomonas]|uniref:Uncharacterized protein n=1 Tax=Pseudomonas viridiflava TaxID=33069 RepID=A0A1Y6JKE9_PSEVI|nr:MULTISPECIES: hypothetical protein [Pseudomonas]VVO26679.1 hypothetical protein PS689_04673 [Pseudomonas fluorescens]MCI3909623.1 hypothetical protein [Pseudomonas viridiflava]MCQ9390245.1 hypothetical protein [Pseudomonas viridiflava]MEE4129747.1 hypothetical protein [Pseudomonas viridiflava]MEE4138071.1 hypothetical protein [Pseudomonas viridiflava]
MRTLAELSFDFIWHLMFTDEDQLEQDLAVRMLENTCDHLMKMTDEERRAFITVAIERRAIWLANASAGSRSSRQRVADEQKQFLEDVISGQFFSQFEEPTVPDDHDRVVPIRSYRKGGQR